VLGARNIQGRASFCQLSLHNDLRPSFVNGVQGALVADLKALNGAPSGRPPTNRGPTSTDDRALFFRWRARQIIWDSTSAPAVRRCFWSGFVSVGRWDILRRLALPWAAFQSITWFARARGPNDPEQSTSIMEGRPNRGERAVLARSPGCGPGAPFGLAPAETERLDDGFRSLGSDLIAGAQKWPPQLPQAPQALFVQFRPPRGAGLSPSVVLTVGRLYPPYVRETQEEGSHELVGLRKRASSASIGAERVTIALVYPNDVAVRHVHLGFQTSQPPERAPERGPCRASLLPDPRGTWDDYRRPDLAPLPRSVTPAAP